MAVAVMLVGRGSGEKTLDGVVTSRNTFQKYYTQSEAYEYIKRILKRDPISVGSGIFFIFKNDVDEQDFLSRRQISKALPRDYLDSLFPLIPKNKSEKISRRSVRISLYEKHTDYFDNFWQTCITLGRFPAIDEYRYDSSILTNPKMIYSILPYKDKEQQIEIVKNQRRGDLLVYLSMNLFEKRKSISAQPLNVQRNIKAFFGTNSAALSEARKFLFSLSSVDKLASAVSSSVEKKLGFLAKDGDYTFHISKLIEQDPIVRILIGCSEKLEAFPGDADLIKIHTISRHISFLTFDDFLEKPIPALIRRLRIDLSRQRVNTEIYSSPSEQRLLYGKSYFIDENYRRFVTQKRFDDKLQDIGIFRLPGLGGTIINQNSKLSEANVRLLGYRILSSSS